MKLYFDFQLGAGWEEVTAYTSDHWYLTKRAASSNYHHAVNLLNVTLRYNSALFALIKNSAVDILVQMREDDETPIFTGYFKPTTDGVYNGIVNLQSIQIEAQDYTEYTNTAVGEPGVAYKNYKIMDPANPTTSIVHALFTKIGLSTSLIDASLTISTVVGAFTSDTESDTCLELLDTLLHEYGYVFSWSDSGLFHPIPWIPSGSASYAFTDSNIQGEIHTSASIKEYEGAEVTWYGLDTKVGTRIYTEDLPFDDDGDFSGYAVLPTVYYPPEANVTDETTGELQKVYQEYTDDGVRYKSSKYVQDAYEMNFALAHADFSEILITENHAIEDHYDTGIVRDIALFYNKKAQVRYNNPTAGSLLLYYMNITADATYKRSEQKGQVQLVAGSTKLMEYKSRFIFDKVTADVLAQALANDTLYGRTTWEFMGSEEVAAGSFVSLSLGDGTTASGFLLESKYDGYYEQYSYTVRGISYSFSPITKRLVVENASSQQQQSEQQALKPTAPSVTVTGDSQFVYQGSFVVPNPSSVTLSLNVDGTIPASYQWYSRNVSGVDVEIPGATSDTLNIPYTADYLLPTDTIITCLVNDKWHGAYSITKKQIDEYRLQITGGTANISYDQFGLNPAPSADQEWTADFYKNDVLQSTGVTYAWSCGGNLVADGAANAKTFNTAIDASVAAGETFVQCSGIYGGKALSTKQVIPISHYDATLDWAEQWDATKEDMYTGDILIGDRVITGRIYAGTLEDDPVHVGYKRLKTGFAFGNKIQVKGTSTTEEKDGFVVVKDGVIVAYMDVLGNATWNGTVTTSGINASVGAINDELIIGENGWQAGGTGTPEAGDTQTFLNDKKMSVQEYDGNIWVDKISMGKQTLLSGVQYDMDIGGRSLSYDEQGNKIGLEIGYLSSDTLEVKQGSLHINTAARDWWVDGNTAYEYAETQPAGAVTQNWNTSCMSSDGSKILAGVWAGRLYFSIDAGTSWTEKQPAGARDTAWNTSCMSSDSSHILVGTAGNGRLYLSTNFGSTWAEVQPAGNVGKQWRASAMTANGSIIYTAVGYGGRIYRSTNFGSTWAEVQPAGNVDKHWQALAVSVDAMHICACAADYLYLSHDFGVTWEELDPYANMGYFCAAMSVDGTKIIIGTYNGRRLYLSINYGVTWTEVRPAGVSDLYWYSVGISSDGTKMFAGEYEGRLYYSINSGSTWAELQPAGAINNQWEAFSLSYNGSRVFVGAGTDLGGTGKCYLISKYRSLITSSTPNFPSAGQWKYVCVDINGNISLENATGTAAQRPTDDCYSQTALVTGFNAVGKHGYYFSDSKRIIGAIHRVSATSWYTINNLNGREEIGETSAGKYYIDAMGATQPENATTFALAKESAIRMRMTTAGIQRSRAGVLTPSGITVESEYADDNTAYSGRFEIANSTDGLTFDIDNGIPNDPAGTTYLSNWASTVDGWVISGLGYGTLAIDTSRLKITFDGSHTNVMIVNPGADPTNKKLILKIVYDASITSVSYRNGSNVAVNIPLVHIGGFYFGTVDVTTALSNVTYIQFFAGVSSVLYVSAIYVGTGAALWYQSAANESSKVYTPPALSLDEYVRQIRVRQYKAGGFTTLFNEDYIDIDPEPAIESNSVANGKYHILFDGTLIQSHKFTASGVVTTAANFFGDGSGNAGYLTSAVTFPTPFKTGTVPEVIPADDKLGATRFASVSATGCTLYTALSSNAAGQTATVSYIAIGDAPD